jgi:Terpene synthase family 2, C-terminal metal binding
MPTLPERATSILSVLGRFSSAQGNPPPAFEWRALVEAKRPGGASETQRRQAARLKRTLMELREWADTRGLAREHIEESAVYATVCTALDSPPGHARALALVIYWIYLLDDFLDRRDWSSGAALAGSQEASHALDVDLAAVLHPLRSVRSGVAARLGGLLLRQAARDKGQEASPGARQLGGALAEIMEALCTEWAALPGGNGRCSERSALVARELARGAAAMSAEARWNSDWARRPDGAELPTYVIYLRNGAISIGMPAVVAVAASFERNPHDAWRRGGAAITAGGSVIRLTNDLHTYFADVEEGKVSAIAIRLRELGFPPCGFDPDTSAEVSQAQSSIGEDLARAVEAFARGQERLTEGSLAYCARHAVAFALAVYGDGSAHRKTPAAA